MWTDILQSLDAAIAYERLSLLGLAARFRDEIERDRNWYKNLACFWPQMINRPPDFTLKADAIAFIGLGILGRHPTSHEILRIFGHLEWTVAIFGEEFQCWSDRDKPASSRWRPRGSSEERKRIERARLHEFERMLITVMPLSDK